MTFLQRGVFKNRAIFQSFSQMTEIPNTQDPTSMHELAIYVLQFCMLRSIAISHKHTLTVKERFSLSQRMVGLTDQRT